MKLWIFRALGLLLILGLVGCSPTEPVRLGYLGSMSGSVADLGEAGLRGVNMAVDEANASGGIHGRLIELVAADDGQEPKAALAALRQLGDAGVKGVVGPMTSAMALAVLPESRQRGLVLVSPTVTGSALFGQDDDFFTVVSSTKLYAASAAQYLAARGYRRIAAIYETRNAAFTQDWVEGFRQRGVDLGLRVTQAEPFTSGQFESYEAAVQRIKAADTDAILYVASAVDTVRLMQMVQQRGIRKPAMGATWSATEQILELGGRNLEGLAHVQMFDRSDVSTRYRAFADAYHRRYQQEPGFASVMAYEATQALILSLQQQREGQSLKQALLEAGPYEGLQSAWNFDRFGDAQRKPYITEIRESRFVAVR